MGGLVWLASYPKSGNTWLRLFLANLFADPRQPYDINGLTGFTFGENRGDLYEQVAGRPFESLDDETINQLRPQVHRLISRTRPDSIFVKTHSALAAVSNVPTITPDVTQGAIYLIRNPLDVAVSYAHHLGRSLGEAVAMMGERDSRLATERHFAFQVLGSWSDHVKSWLDAPICPLHVMRYEDMIAKPAKTFADLVGFLRLPASKKRVSKAIEFSSFNVLASQEAESGFKERPPTADRFFRAGKVGGWRTALAPQDVERLIADHGPTMRRFGYLDDSGRPLS